LSIVGKVEHKTRLKTIRISESLASTLQKDAADEGTTVNALINTILSQYYGWGKMAREFGLVSINKPIFMRLIEEVSDETLVRLGRQELLSTWKGMAEYWLHDSTPDKMMEVLRLRARLDRQTESRTTQDKDTYTIVFRNDFGPRFSIACESALREFVKQSFHVEPKISRGDTVVTARFKVNPKKPPL
jgi:hypothetical protein